MKNISKIIISLLLILSLVGCKENKTTAVKLNPSISLDKAFVSIFEGESETVVATLENYQDEIIWSSENEEIAKVDNGVILGIKEGNTKVIASINGDSKSIDVVVTPKEIVYEFMYIDSEFSIIKGHNYTLDPSISRNGTILSNTRVEYQTEGTVLELDNNVIKPLDYGTQKITIKGFYNDELVTSIEVNISVVEFVEIRTNIPNNTVELSTISMDSLINEYSTNGVQVYLNGVLLNEPSIEYNVENEEIINFSDSKIKALKEGNTKVNISYSTIYSKYEVSVNVNVTKAEITNDFSFVVKGNADPKAAFRETGDVKIDFTGSGIDLSKVTKVISNGTEIKKKYSGNILTLRNAPEGENEYRLVMKDYDVLINGIIYSYEISDSTSLHQFIEDYNRIFGYTVVTSDIDLKGVYINARLDQWFRTTFNGLGHTISNFKTKAGFLTSYSELGTLKNVQFKDVIIDCKENTKERFGVFGQEICGTIEDVLVEATFININERELNSDRQNLLFGCTFTTTIKNVIVIANVGEYSGSLYGLGNEYVGGQTTIDGLYIVCNKTIKQLAPSSSNMSNTGTYLSVESLLESANFAGFNNWNIESGKLPELKK